MSGSSDKRKRASVAAVFWIILALILLIVFLVNQDNIVRVLKETDFFVHVFGEQPDFIENYELPESDSSLEENLAFGDNEGVVETIQLATPQSVTSTTPVVQEPKNDVAITESAEVKSTVQPVTPPPVVQEVSSKQSLFFVFVNGDGTVERKEAIRSVPKSTTPLTASLKALLEGPNAQDRENGYVSFIPEGTRLLSVSIQEGTAFINVSEEFSFNQYGVEGYLAQLMQVVYTATSFNTIKNVRFIIEGEQSSYLGNDGVWIGAPLSRTDFK